MPLRPPVTAAERSGDPMRTSGLTAGRGIVGKETTMAHEVIRNEHDIEELLAECDRCVAEELTQGGTYEQGIAAAIQWLTDSDAPEPLGFTE